VFASGKIQGGPRGDNKDGGHTLGGALHPCGGLGLLSDIFSFQYFSYFRKIFSVNFPVNWTPFDIPFL